MIRKVKPSDREQLLQLIREFYIIHNRQKLFSKELALLEAYKDINKTVNKTATEYLKNKKYIVFVAEDKNRLIGYICGNIKLKPYKIFDSEGYVEDWFVNESYRSKKIGKMLFERLIEEFKKRECTHIAVSSYAVNKKAINIYYKIGFIDKEIVMIKKIN